MSQPASKDPSTDTPATGAAPRVVDAPMSASPASVASLSSSLDVAPDPDDANIGAVFGDKYVIEKKLGEGGMGVVYRARHKAIGKRFAIKLLHTEATKDPEVVERFKVEAQAASAIGSEHIIDITDFAALPNGTTYFVMEYLDGRALSALFEDLVRCPTQRLAKIAKQIALGLGAAHQAGIVHRDLKPDNIVLCKRSGGETDFVKILDFGIAKVGQNANKLTKAGAIFGTPHYMSPEQASGSPVDHRTDIYALGVILYEGAVGRVPFDADNFMGILTQHMYKAPVPPRAVPECPPDLSPGLEVIIMRCLRKKPEERYSSMDELAEDLDRLMRGEVPKAASDIMALSAGYQSIAASALAAAGMPKPIPGQPPGRAGEKRKWPLVAGLAGVVVVVGIAVAALVGPGKGDAKPQPSVEAAPTPAPTPSPSPSPSATPAPSSAPTPAPTVSAATKLRVVLVSSSAASTKVWDGDKLLGDAPWNVELEAGAKRTVTLKAPGYVDKTVILDEKSPAKVSIAMAFKGGGAPAVGTTKKVGEAENPWGK